MTQASTCSRVSLRTVSSTLAWSAASDASNSEWSKSKSAPAPVAVVSSARAVAVLLDRGLLKLGVALEAERLREADDGRGGGAGAARELLGGLEGGLVEVVDDVAGDVLLRARELVEALGDVGRERLAVRLAGVRRLVAGASWSSRAAAGRVLVAVLLTARLIRLAARFSLPRASDATRTAAPARCGWIAPMDLEHAPAADQPQHDRLRPRARHRARCWRPRDAAPARPRRARRPTPSSCSAAAARSGSRSPPRTSSPSAAASRAGLVGARLAARHRDRDRRRLVALALVHAPGRPQRAPARRRRQPGDGARLRLAGAQALAERPAALAEADPLGEFATLPLSPRELRRHRDSPPPPGPRSMSLPGSGGSTPNYW